MNKTMKVLVIIILAFIVYWLVIWFVAVNSVNWPAN